MMGMALAVLHWSPQVFWASSPNELYAAFDFHVEMHNPESSAEQDWQKWRKKEFGE